jgi:diguanylate cyclase (GGDEF)-like protein
MSARSAVAVPLWRRIRYDRLRQNWTHILLGPDPKQRRYVLRSLLAVFAHLSGCVVVEATLRLGLVVPREARWYQAASLVASLLTYGLVRSGATRRRRDPAMTVLQMLLAQTLAAWVYALVPAFRGAFLALQVAVVFYGAFSVSRRTQMLLCAYGLSIMAAVMTVMHLLRPRLFPAEYEAINFMVLLTTQPSVAFVSAQFGALRQRLIDQKAELESALRRNQELAITDELTRLHNRRYLTELLRHSVAQHRRSGHPLSVALIDLDHFKIVNDRYGHHVGDEVLQRFAEQTRKVLRASELVGRWGGEEFLVLFPLGNATMAGATLHRLRAVLESMPASDSQPTLRVGFSAGIAQLGPRDTMESLLERADRALYRAKAGGRGRDIVAAVDAVPDTVVY